MKEIKFRYVIIQACLALLFIWVTMWVLDHVVTSRELWAVGASSVAASAFIVFTNPHCAPAQPLKMIGAYLMSILVGVTCFHLTTVLTHYVDIPMVRSLEFMTAFAVGVAIVTMTICRFLHPPAAGMTLILVVEPWRMPTVVVVIGAICILSFIHFLIGKHLKDLTCL